MENRLYDKYSVWKSWNAKDTILTEYSFEVFERELDRINITPIATVLEIGFGDGQFLDWAKKKGYSVVGIEISEELHAAAISRGHRSYHGSLPELDLGNEKFDLIVAFDVFEHLDIHQLQLYLKKMSEILCDDGRILARFPNGSSPFSRHYQNGDATHISSLNAKSLGQIALFSGLELEACNNSVRLLSGKRKKYLKKLAFIARDIIEITIGLIYFGERIPLDPNLTCILKHRVTR